MVDLILNANKTEPTDYIVRKTVKAVVIDESGRTLTFGPYLLGGGIEEGESEKHAIDREMMEEAGIEVEILKPLGRVVSYRDALKKKYIVDGFLCRFKRKVSEPTTTDEDEKKQKLLWHTPEEAIEYVEREVEKTKSEGDQDGGDVYQGRLYNKLTTLAFLKEAFGK